MKPMQRMSTYTAMVAVLAVCCPAPARSAGTWWLAETAPSNSIARLDAILDGKSDAWVDGNELSFDMFRQAILPSLKPTQVIKSTPTYYAAQLPAGGQKHTLYIITARGKAATCRVELHYDAKDAAAATKIGASLKAK